MCIYNVYVIQDNVEKILLIFKIKTGKLENLSSE